MDVLILCICWERWAVAGDTARSCGYAAVLLCTCRWTVWGIKGFAFVCFSLLFLWIWRLKREVCILPTPTSQFSPFHALFKTPSSRLLDFVGKVSPCLWKIHIINILNSSNTRKHVAFPHTLWLQSPRKLLVAAQVKNTESARTVATTT